MVSLFIFKGQKTTRAHEADVASGGEKDQQPISAEHDFKANCTAVAEESGLTERELDMLLLLGQGRSIASISKLLYVSENTTKSHVRSIYLKRGIHSKQELIDLVNT
jgi:DNA-binding CsgD family transcriptional regulator